MFVSQTNPLGGVLFSYANTFFCSNIFASCWLREWKHSIRLAITEYRLCVTSPRTFWGSLMEHFVSWELAYSLKKKRKQNNNNNNNNNNSKNKHNDKKTSKQANKQTRNKLLWTKKQTSKIKQQQQQRRPQQNKRAATTKIKYIACLKLLMLTMVSFSVSSQTAAVSDFRGYCK